MSEDVGQKKGGRLFHLTKCKSPEENSPPSQATANECKTLSPTIFSLLMATDLLLCQVTEEATTFIRQRWSGRVTAAGELE